MSDLCDISSSNHWLDAPKIRKETREYIAHSWNDRITILIYTIFSPIEHWKSGNAQLSQGDTPAFHLEWSRNAFSMSHGLQSPWSSPGQNTGVGSLSLLQGVFPTHRSNSGLPHYKQILYPLSHQGSPRRVDWVAYHFSSRSSQPRNWTGVSAVAELQADSLPAEPQGKPKYFMRSQKLKGIFFNWNFEIKQSLSLPKQLKFCACV